jgi:hypothetical protein
MTLSVKMLYNNSLVYYLKLGCLHPVACVRTGDGVFYPSTQRDYRRLILLLILLDVSVVRPSSGRKYIIS